MRIFLAAMLLVAGLSAARAQTMLYHGLCEASAGTYIDEKHFVVASDETNTLQIYKRGEAQPVDSVPLDSFTGFDKSDLEGAAAIGDRVYWISSHSFNNSHDDKKKRKIFFATHVGRGHGTPKITGIGKVVQSLRDAIVRAAHVEPDELNIEALAATPEGGLLIGLRAPLNHGQALLIPFKNPAAAVDNGDEPDLGEAIPLDLKGNGFRSMDLISTAPVRYAIVAGPVSDSPNGFTLFRWSGKKSDDPEKVRPLQFERFKPESAMLVPGTSRLQLLSDDGDYCSDEGHSPRQFKSVDVDPWASK
jgi:hypothetical protein